MSIAYITLLRDSANRIGILGVYSEEEYAYEAVRTYFDELAETVNINNIDIEIKEFNPDELDFQYVDFEDGAFFNITDFEDEDDAENDE